MIKPKKNPVTKLVAAGVKAAAKAAGKKTTKPLANPKSAVKTVAADRSRASKFNQGSLMRTTDDATGAAARKGAAQLGVTGKTGSQPPVKINTEIFGPLKRKIAAKQPLSKAETKANKRGFKAASKPTNKVGSKADKALRSRTKSVVMSKEETKANYNYYYGKGSGEGITQINKRVTPKNEAMSVRKMPKKSK